MSKYYLGTFGKLLWFLRVLGQLILPNVKRKDIKSNSDRLITDQHTVF